ncbi:hypothetical protein G9F71_027010 [Clostridium sp. FP2]|uniref:hypothetical protein n=1 Tax=Clostridium sp. FP2 TaxID=2724481 RepID=UPI0013E93185|nr:hypothetical protein [Clostridium sp. FP2]MBZ9626456.1 hypothetical protein [Clostridium sp. FP2]
MNKTVKNVSLSALLKAVIVSYFRDWIRLVIVKIKEKHIQVEVPIPQKVLTPFPDKKELALVGPVYINDFEESLVITINLLVIKLSFMRKKHISPKDKDDK